MNKAKIKEGIHVIYKERIQMLVSYYNDAFHYLKAFDLDIEDVKDALQDTYIEAFTNIDKVRDESRLKFWFLKIAKRQGLKYINRNKRKSMNEKHIFDYINFSEMGAESLFDKQENDFIRKINREMLRKFILELNDKERSVLILYYDYGYKLKDIAALMRENDSSIRSISKRSKEKLRRMMEAEGVEL
ncbi:MAG: sigma-70 family RNA polymerase sigma factor [Anaerovoracaceae bacterium]|nr:sigma-70 family RNA polymerase sigma factor [Bacillota bacterium]MEE0517545.1 sigma-70 family RNA polymerase sigma factor [Anaerovoracaceae bacterium]